VNGRGLRGSRSSASSASSASAASAASAAVLCAAALLAAGLLAAALVAGCGGSSSTRSSAGEDPPSASAGLQGLILKPPKAAPALALHSYTGQPVSLAALRGKAVLVTFVYTHCPDVCPLIVSDLAAAQRGLGKTASRLRILAVTVDPRRDTPAAIRTFLAARGATGRMDYLLGTSAQLHRTWKAWDVAVTTGTNQLTDGHSAVIYGITASARMAVVYPSNVTPAQIMHDVPLLAAE
jgi:protein SCO1/2